jgi:hypothetical protein
MILGIKIKAYISCMKKLDLNFNLKDLDGGEIAEAKVSKLLAGLLMSQKEGDAVKFFDWAVTLHKTGIIEVDSSDFSTIKKLVSDNKEYLTMIAKAQLLKHFDTIV